VAINKSNSPTWVKITLIVLIIAFVASLITIVANPFQASNTQTTGAQTGADQVSQVDAQYQPQVAGLTSQLQSDPTSYTVLVNLGNTYFDWAAQIQQASQANTSAVGADQPLWTSAKDAYARAVAVSNKESSVRTDYAITLFYTGDTTKAIEIVTAVTKDDPKFPYGWFNLGIFKKALGDNKTALAAFQKAIELDPKGAKISIDYAKQQVTELKAAPASSTSATSAP